MLPQASKTPKGSSTPKARTPLQKVNNAVPAAVAATRPTGFYSTPTKKIEVPALGLSNLTRPTIASSAKSPRAVTPRAANITPRSAGKAAPSPAAKPATPKAATPKALVRNSHVFYSTSPTVPCNTLTGHTRPHVRTLVPSALSPDSDPSSVSLV